MTDSNEVAATQPTLAARIEAWRKEGEAIANELTVTTGVKLRTERERIHGIAQNFHGMNGNKGV